MSKANNSKHDFSLQQSSNKNLLNNIHSLFVINKLSQQINKRKILRVIRYNKELLEKFNISIDDYKKYNQIEIELELVPKKQMKGYKNEFIKYNILHGEYFHIYFDDNKEEVKRNFITVKDKVSKIKILIDIEIKSLKELFYQCRCIKKIKFLKFKRKDIYNMSYMFSYCELLEEIDFLEFKTDNVKDFNFAFSNCYNLKNLDLSKFKTDNVKTMRNMFSFCHSLKSLDLLSFNTKNVYEMNRLFIGCKKIISLDLSKC